MTRPLTVATWVACAALLVVILAGCGTESLPCDSMQGCTPIPIEQVPAPERAADVREQTYIDCIEAGGTGTSCTPAGQP